MSPVRFALAATLAALPAAQAAAQAPAPVEGVRVTVTGGDGAAESVRLWRFTPRASVLGDPPPEAGASLGLADSGGEVFGLDIGLIGALTPDRQGREAEGVALGARISSLGVSFGGALRTEGADSLSLGAGFDVSRWRVGGALSFGLDDADDAGAGARIEAGYAIAPGLDIGGAVSIVEDRAPRGGEIRPPEIAAGVRVRLDF